MTEHTKHQLTGVQAKFILHWGEMGTRWGINRTVAQIHALLFLSPLPLNAEDIAETLGVARSNVSNSLRELQGWGIVRVVHILGDRRDHFESMKDVWEMFRIIVDERRKREADPTLAMLREAVTETKKAGAADAYTRERLGDMLEFFELMTAWCEQTRKLPTAAVIRLVKMGDRIGKLLGGARAKQVKQA
jgi:DNA-binding transcriptional regulator GbsR (MarR family)